MRPVHDSFVRTETVRSDEGDDIQDNEEASIFMPALNLNRDCSWSTNDLTFTQRKGDVQRDNDSKEIIRKTEAFKEWLSAKM